MSGIGRRSDYVMTVASELVGLVATLVVFRLAAVAWGTVGFGEYVLARRAITLLQPAFLMGLGLAVTRDIAMGESADRDDTGAALPAAVVLALVASGVAVGVLNAFPHASAALLLGSAEAVSLVGPVSLATVGLVLHGITYGALRGSMAATAVNLFQVVSMALAPLAAFAWPEPGPARVVGVTGALWIVISGLTLSIRLVQTRAAWAGLPIRPSIRRLLAYGGPRVPGEFGLVLMLALPVILTAHIAGPAAAGFVGLGLSLVRMAGLVAAPVGKVLLPAASAAAARGEGRALRRATRRLVASSVGIPAVAVLIFLPTARWTLTTYLGDGFAAAVPLVRITILGAVPFALYVLLRNLIDALEVRPLNTRNIAIALSAMALAAAGTASAAGAAAGSVLGFLVLGLLTAADARRLLRRVPVTALP